jgi:small conductance mechanosensitive channel
MEIFMSTASTNLSNYINEISRIGGEFGPMLVKGMILLLIVLILAKYLARLLVPLLVKIGVSDRKAAYSVTGLHVLVLLVGTIIVLSMVGFPGALLVRVIMVILMVVLAAYIIAKPYVPQLPFQKGDIIKTSSGSGTVDQMSIINTRLRTFDGKMIYIPNQKIFNDTVTNSSVRPNRRLDIDFFIPYDQDVEKVKATVGEILQQEEIVLEKPAPRIVIDKFTHDYMEMKARFWVEK